MTVFNFNSQYIRVFNTPENVFKTFTLLGHFLFCQINCLDWRGFREGPWFSGKFIGALLTKFLTRV